MPSTLRVYRNFFLEILPEGSIDFNVVWKLDPYFYRVYLYYLAIFGFSERNG